MTQRKKQSVRNWKEYNKNLEQQGSITFWIDEKLLKFWHRAKKTGKRGRPYIYSDVLIESLLVIRFIYKLPLRQTMGFVKSYFKRSNIKLGLPNYSILSRRQKKLKIKLPVSYKPGDKLHVVVDSTGLKVYGEGEWKVKIHGPSKHRTWMKLHMGFNEKDNEILGMKLTTNQYTDSEVLPDLLKQIKCKIKQLSGDKAYDRFSVYEKAVERGVKAIIAPSKNAKIGLYANGRSPPPNRDKNLQDIKEQGLETWKANNAYHRRSLAETGMFRFKTAFGTRLRSRNFRNQVVEATIKCKILNIMNKIGTKSSYMAAC